MIERHSWRSPHTGCEMPLRRFGNRGAVVIYVPSSGGDADEFASYEMPRAVAPWIERGHAQVFAVDGWARHALWNDSLPPAERIRAYARYERYVESEVPSWVAAHTDHDTPPWLVGCSFGAFVASNVLFKYPSRIRGACGLGGVYGMWHRLEGYHDDDVYHHTPLEYVPRLEDPEIVNRIRGSAGLMMFAAAEDEWLGSTMRMFRVMRERRLPCSLDVWPAPAAHHESVWRVQLREFFSRRFGPPGMC